MKAVVVWDDAHASLEAITIEEAKKMRPYRTESIGYLISKNKHGVVLAYDKYGRDLWSL